VEFAEAHPEETLVVVTGDHECGGLTLGWSGTQYESYFGVLENQVISFQKFSDEVVKKYKEQCGGACSFDDMKPLITKYFGLKFEGDPDRDRLVLKDYQLDMVEDAYARTMAGEKETASDPATERIYGMYEPLTVTLTHILNNKAGLAWTSYKHTGVPVITSALGVGGEIFQGYYDNTDIALKIMSVMGVEAKVHSVSRRESEKTAAK
jgi:alkaline phosphatase